MTQHIHTCGICTAAACHGTALPARRLRGHVQDRHGRRNAVTGTHQVADFWCKLITTERCNSEGQKEGRIKIEQFYDTCICESL